MRGAAEELNLQIWRQIKMGRDDRAVLIGKTGCGKTTLARFLIEDSSKPFSVVWNPKGSDSVLKWRHKHVTSLRKLYEAADKETRRIVYTPDAYLAEDEANQSEFGYWVYEKLNRRVYLDEATSIVYGGVKVPRWLNALINRGRERGVSTMVATQRPSGVPSNILSESEHWYIFQTLLPQDRQKVEAITGISVEDQMGLSDHEFFYFNLSKGLLPRKLKLNLNGVRTHGRTRVATV
jgi:hypothetical protein